MKYSTSLLERENWMNDFFKTPFSPTKGFWNEVPINVKQTEKEYTLELAIPGFKKEEVDIKVKNNMLVLSGKKESEKESDDDGFSRREYNMQQFERQFSLPENVDDNAIDAKQVDGMLIVRLPLKEVEKEQVKSITVN